MKLLLDTSILIDVLRHRNRRREFLAELVRGGHTLATTTLNVAEIYAGMRPAEEGRTEALLNGLELYELSGTSARLAGRLKGAWAREKGFRGVFFWNIEQDWRDGDHEVVRAAAAAFRGR